MRAFVLGLVAAAMAVTVSACSAKSGALAPVKTTPAELETYVGKLSAQPFKLQAKGAADLASVRDALPKTVSLTWASLEFDAATGATVLRDVKLTPADTPEIGIGISELRIWDFNTELAKARLQGQRLSETGDLARRIEAIGASVFGLETLMAPAVEAYAGAIENTVTGQLPPEVAAEVAGSMDTRLDDYEFSIGHFVFDDVKLRPYELRLAQLPPENGFAEVMPLLQSYVAASRSFGVDTFFMHQFKLRMAMSQAGRKMSGNFTADAYGVRGIRGSDMDAAFMRGIAFDMDAPMDPAGASTTSLPPQMNITGGIDYVSIEAMRLDKVARYLALSEWPPRTESDLMSYGRFNVKNEHFGLNGHDIYSVGDIAVDASKWRWFIPAKVSIKTNDVVYNVKALMDFVSEVETAQTGANPIDPGVMQLLGKYGLDRPSLDFALGWDWNPDTGATSITTAFGLDKYMRADLKYEGGFPTFKGVSDLIPGGFETARGDEIGALFQKSSTLKGFELNVSDEGGLDKIFALAAEVGKMTPPDQTGGIAVFANTTPDGLRRSAVAGVYMIADQAETAVPGAKKLIAPFGDFVQRGGKVKFTLSPRKPVPLADTTKQASTAEITPIQLLEQFNAKTVHTPPAR